MHEVEILHMGSQGVPLTFKVKKKLMILQFEEVTLMGLVVILPKSSRIIRSL